MPDDDVRFYDFGQYQVDVENQMLLRDGEEQKISSQQFRVLKLLVAKHGRVVTREELSKAGWNGPGGLGDPLNNVIYSLRTALGDDRHKIIALERGLGGYRFNLAVRETGAREEKPRTREPALRLRSKADPLHPLTWDQAKIMISNHKFYCSNWNETGAGIAHEYEVRVYDDGVVVVDHATDLMWEKGVAISAHEHCLRPEERVAELRTRQFGGFDDWRLPTLEEAMSLVTTEEDAVPTARARAGVRPREVVHLDPIFERAGANCIWTADLAGAHSQWVVDFEKGECNVLPRGAEADTKAVRSISAEGGPG
jgi:DNA-binding winged helix-turn-helix (wHTH) protein